MLMFLMLPWLIVDTDAYWTGGDANWDSIIDSRDLRVQMAGAASSAIAEVD